MDLRPISATPTADERAAVDAVLQGHGGLPASSGAPPADLGAPADAVLAPGNPAPAALRDVRARRHLLLPALQAAQARRGFVSAGALGYVCERLGVPPAEAYGVASFYALLSLGDRPPIVAHVCDDVACQVGGAGRLCDELTRELGPPYDGSPPDGRGGAPWLRSPCLGLCEQAPAALVTISGPAPREVALGNASAADVRAALAHPESARPTSRTIVPQLGASPQAPGAAAVVQTESPQAPGAAAQAAASQGALRLLRRVGRVDPTSLDDYRRLGGYQALRRAFELGPAGVLREVGESRLLGRGGAAFPTGRKWEAVARATARPRYLVCNADESEPGTFKDRVLLEADPFALVESMTIAALAVGAERGYVYVRGEYALCAERVEAAARQCRARGLLGEDIMGRGLRFDLEVRRGAGAYICGEETALFNSIEGLRGEPRNKPPFPVEAGLFGKPTVVNNVETLYNVPDIVLHGAAAYRAIGTEGSTGTRLFCLSGAVARPGLYEVPFGATLGALLDLAGGVRGGRPLQAILLGGAAGTFVTAADLGLPLTFEDTRRAGATLGSGVVLVLDDQVPIWPLLQRLAAFFRDESCGQCVPCRVGTVRQEELLARLAAGRPLGSRQDELHLLRDLGQVMRDASICGLGQTASSAVESAVARLPLFPEGAP